MIWRARDYGNPVDGMYDVVLADPPWRYNDRGSNGAAENHYSTMAMKDICDLPVSELAAQDSVLFLWVTWPLLVEGLEVMKAWDFQYKTQAFTWVKHYAKSEKPFFGLGRWTRGNSEVCLLGVRGKPKALTHGVRSLLEEEGVLKAPKGVHSAKPPEVRKRIVELMGADKMAVELFARENTEGWDTWGDQGSPTLILNHGISTGSLALSP